MTILRARTGSSLLETVLFLGILSIISGTIVAVFISTQDARVRQRAVAELEQQGTQTLAAVTKLIRRAETVVIPPEDSTGSILLLQMAQNDEFPTIVTRIGSGILLAQKSATSALLSPNITVSNLVFRNVGDANVWMSFDLTAVIPTLQKRTYTRSFKGTATLFPDDQGDAGGCGSCPEPACISGRYTWYVCESDVCTQSDTTFSC